ncbi:hypothetical protein OIY81_446 [Cryptosporidium canis]|uniref:Multiple myeloma tumor-associated protein 2-like N-terminal domain-containing protein n=1 Tax=Cryptosporidium canis TaxID=195482 RepID=A0ABQ8PB72_9CRYT|nr:hypothetical protein OIY81_446 [Cryptosporidium canis]KAJ1614506.1 hypothetical protein OJ252_638 [Cryptosporidium canis]
MDLTDSIDIAKQSGTRGGVEQFNWDSLRSIPRREREHYLGHSLYYSRPRGRGRGRGRGGFNRYDWQNKAYNSKSNEYNSSEFLNEREKIISKEQRIMNKLLGIQENTNYCEKSSHNNTVLSKAEATNTPKAVETFENNGTNRNRRMFVVSNKSISKEYRRTKRRSFSRSLST